MSCQRPPTQNTPGAMAMPHLSAQGADRNYTVSEEDLYKYTRNRWIYNEDKQLSSRYLKFNLRQLLKTAVAAVSREGATCCTRVLKCREGLNNKAYLLTMDNGSEVFAKLPNPIAGPAYYTTASEVATRSFLRDVLNIPTPRILAWSADRNNLVGAEYILEEKAPGVPLGGLWVQWPMKFKIQMISQIVEVERQLTSATFTNSGCIYSKGDIPDATSTRTTLTNSQLQPSLLERYRIGPLVSSGLWRGDRVSMDMHRGPFNEPLEFIEAMAKNEIQFITAHACPRMNYHRSSTDPELPKETLDLLDKYLQIAPAMVPPSDSTGTHSPTLWHPDLHLDNVFVDPETKQITCIIDWQSATVMPLFYQRRVPVMFKHPGPISDNWVIPQPLEDYDSLAQSEKAKVDSEQRSEICHKYYLAETSSKNPKHWAALQLKNVGVRTEPSLLVQNVWEGRDVFFLRRALLEIVEKWPGLCPESGQCPINFSKQELASHESEEESLSIVSEILSLFREKWELPPNGMVPAADFERIRTALIELRDSFIEDADDEMEKAARVWPYQDIEN